MDVSKKLFLIRMADKIEKNRMFAEKIGTKNKSKSVGINKEKVGPRLESH